MHTCGYSVMMRCIGYPKKEPDEYKLSTWALSDDEILEQLPNLMERGIFLYYRGNFGGAVDLYRRALNPLEQMSLQERPHTKEWNTLQEKKVPLQLNYAQCKLCLSEYNEVITHTTSVLEFDRDNATALLLRAKAHIHLYNLVQARRDYERVIMINSPLAGDAERKLTKLNEAVQDFVADQQRRLVGRLGN